MALEMSSFVNVESFPGVWTRSLSYGFDSRGYFTEELRKHDLPPGSPEFIQDSLSFSKQNVLRGMHIQNEQWQIITLLEGEIIDVLLNLDKNSPNFLQTISFELSWGGLNQLLVSPGIAHGFAVLSESARIHYKSNVYYGSTAQFGVHWDSAEIKKYWPKKMWELSERDKNFPKLSKLLEEI